VARRPVFVPTSPGDPQLVRVVEVEFEWSPGFSRSQKQKSIASLHEAAAAAGIEPVLEVSTKSTERLGVRLSAFNLGVELSGGEVVSLEAAFQGSKVFEQGGPFEDLYTVSPRDAKRDPRLKESGRLVRFEWDGMTWPLEPKTAFYDWLYLQALRRLDGEAERLLEYEGFTDIEFNPAKSINCQARSCALYVSLRRRNTLGSAMGSPDAFLAELRSPDEGGDEPGVQQSMF